MAAEGQIPKKEGLRMWRSDEHAGALLKGGRGRCCGRVCGCSIILVLVIVVGVIASFFREFFFCFGSRSVAVFPVDSDRVESQCGYGHRMLRSMGLGLLRVVKKLQQRIMVSCCDSV